MFKVDYAVKYNNNEDEKVENWFEGEKPYIDERTGIIAYKVVLGWYTFYITEEMLKEGINLGLIEEPKSINNFPFSIYKSAVGISSYYRLSKSLKKSTLDKLKEVIEEFEHCPKIWTVKESKCNWYKDNEKLEKPICEDIAAIIIDIEKRVILDKLVFKGDTPNFTLADVETFDVLMEHLTQQSDAFGMNTKNIMKRFEYNDFYNMDKFNQRCYRYNFTVDFYLSAEEQMKRQEEYPDEVKAELQRSFLIINGICWQGFMIEKGTWFVRVLNVNDDIKKVLWLKVIIPYDKDEQPYFAYMSDTLKNETLKYKYLYLTELNRDYLVDFFKRAYSADSGIREFYDNNIHHLSEFDCPEKYGDTNGY